MHTRSPEWGSRWHRIVEIEGLELSTPHNGLLERIHDASVQTSSPSVGAALRAIALGLQQLADALDPTPSPPDRSRSGRDPVRMRGGS